MSMWTSTNPPIPFNPPDDSEPAEHAGLDDSEPAEHAGLDDSEQISGEAVDSFRPQWKQQILDDFTQWLDDLDDMPEEDWDGDAGPHGPDLETLLREFTALRQEVRLQSRSSNKVGGQVEQLAGELSTKLDAVNAVAASIREDVPKARKESKQRVVREIVEVVEAVKRARAEAESLSIPRLTLTPRSKERARQRVLSPLRMLDARISDLIRRIGLEEIARVGQPFDSDSMRVVLTSSTGAIANTVTEILRQGYSLDGDILRIAEVVVEKGETN